MNNTVHPGNRKCLWLTPPNSIAQSHLTEGPAMFMPICILIYLSCSFILCLVSFILGRCARRLPVIDDGLPWVMSRSMISNGADNIPGRHQAGPDEFENRE